ncbi:MAG: serine/threonine protein phosphatase [Akkermansiaceae bacterium]|jgi:serine/threonine protein phosphatase 1|nr:serine/threonine protein phosphatase [Akkermansiaceae bacterium]
MRTLVIGDIHGCLSALKALIKFVSPNEDDTIVTVGDYIDRGPDSKGVIDFLTKYRKSNNLITLKGNHEQMMENALDSEQEHYFWLVNGGDATLDSFRPKGLSSIDDAYWDFMADCPLYHETENHIIAHAGLDPELPLNEQPEEALLWKRIFDTRPHVSGKTLICGHTSQRNGDPLVLEHAVCIDTYPTGSGWLTCLDIDTGTYWQANRQGETRQAEL